MFKAEYIAFVNVVGCLLSCYKT